MKIDDTPVALERGLLFQTCCALSSFFLFGRENERCLPSSAVIQHVASSLERSENDALPSSPTKTMPCLQSRASPSEFTTPALPGSQAWHDSVLDMSPVLMRRTLPMSVKSATHKYIPSGDIVIPYVRRARWTLEKHARIVESAFRLGKMR